MYHKTQIFVLQQLSRSINEPLTSLSSFIYMYYVPICFLDFHVIQGPQHLNKYMKLTSSFYNNHREV
jgi:hypothetical protein